MRMKECAKRKTRKKLSDETLAIWLWDAISDRQASDKWNLIMSQEKSFFS